MSSLARAASSWRVQRWALIHSRQLSSTTGLKETLISLMPKKQAALKKMKTEHGNKIVDKVTIDQLIGGARSIKSMLWETSLLDPMEGIRFRGYTIPELQEKLPSATGGAEPLPESLLWLLLTGEVPTKAQVDSLTADLHSRSKLPDHVPAMIANFPKGMHPMTQFSSAILACQTDSVFAAEYAKGCHKSTYWEHTYEDILNLLARLPEIAALIYKCTYSDGKMPAADHSLDYAANFCKLLGYDAADFKELMRLYIVIHSDHEGGNASAHTCHLVGSTLSDPYLSLSASMNALAGPLHGLANQEVLGWLLGLQATLKEQGKPVSKESITEFAWETLNSGKVIPGYGHAVLRKTDPRYTCQQLFALKHLPDYELFKVVNTVYEVMPGVLTEHGKTKNPYPNVDSHSGVLLKYYGFDQYDYYTVLFGVGRAYGVLAQLFWDRALGLPLERPKSVTSAWLERFIEDHPDGLR
jgi:citrate synthase